MFLFVINNLTLNMEGIYHGCFTKNADGTNKTTAPNVKCLIPINNPFLKQPQDIKNCGDKTQSCTKEEPIDKP